MDVPVDLDEDVLRDLDELVGIEGRGAFIAEAVRKAVDEARRWKSIMAAAGSISDTGHIWDPDPAAWVHNERRSHPRRFQ